MTLPIPMFVCHAPQGALLVSVNGRIAGEAGPSAKFSFPLGEGVHYLAFSPLGGGYLPMTRRIAILGGALQPALDGSGEAMDILSWPGGVHELTVRLPRLPTYAPSMRRIVDAVRFDDAYGGHRARLLDQGALSLEIESDDGATLCVLPAGSPVEGHLAVEIGAPTIVTISGPAVDGGEYRTIVAREAEGWRVCFDGAGDSIVPPESGALRVLCDLRDTVGHGRLSEHVYRDGAFHPARHEHIWYQGQPHWPHSAFSTACAFVEAVCLREEEEARGYLTPDFRRACDLPLLIEEWSDVQGWSDPRYQRGAEPVQIGLIRAIQPGRRAADIVRFDVRQAQDGTQGGYQIAGIQGGESAMG